MSSEYLVQHNITEGKYRVFHYSSNAWIEPSKESSGVEIMSAKQRAPEKQTQNEATRKRKADEDAERAQAANCSVGARSNSWQKAEDVEVCSRDFFFDNHGLRTSEKSDNQKGLLNTRKHSDLMMNEQENSLKDTFVGRSISCEVGS
jgi:hypothetical protein